MKPQTTGMCSYTGEHDFEHFIIYMQSGLVMEMVVQAKKCVLPVRLD